MGFIDDWISASPVCSIHQLAPQWIDAPRMFQSPDVPMLQSIFTSSIIDD
jgi:hypothetical protein